MTKRKRQSAKGKGWLSFLKRDRKKKTATAVAAPRKRKKKDAPLIAPWLKVALTIVGFALLAAGLTAGFMTMERYVKTLPGQQQRVVALKLVNPPAWLGQAWIDRIVETAHISQLNGDDSAARLIAERLGRIPWLDDIAVQETPQHLNVSAYYRRPIVKVAVGGRDYYVDEKMIVFDALPLTKIAVPSVVGFTQRSVPSAGTVWLAEDVKAATDLVYVLSLMDQQMTTAADPIQKPLLDEIESVDVENFAGRRSAARPHIVLNITDGTKVHWGAAWGQASRYLEAHEKDKVTKLYQNYVEYGHTLTGKVRFIELRQPQSLVPRPQ